MILTVLFLTLVSLCLAQTADKNVQQRSPRASQGELQYTDPDGLKVYWKLYTPENQGQTQQAVNARRTERAETNGAKQQVVQAPIEKEPQYQPYSAIPSHIKQLLVQAYSPQGPYVDPGAFFYQAPVNSPISSAVPHPTKQDQSAFSDNPVEQSYLTSAVNYRAAGYEPAALQSSRQVSSVPGNLGGIKYKDEDRIYQRSAELPYGSVIPSQSRIKPQYQPYKQIQESQSQYQQYNKQVHSSQSQQPQYQQYNKQVHSAQSQQPQYQQYNKQVYSAQSQQPQYQQYNKQVHSAQSQQPQYQQYKQVHSSQSQEPQYQQINKQPSQVQRYKQDIPQSQLIKPVTQTNYEKNMPIAIQTLLNYQAQLPYNVIANHIFYRPKELFIPKPLPESAKIARQYPSKVYFVKADGEMYDGPDNDMKKQVKLEKRY